ncbi:MAG: Rieske 2Fe-2S protein [Chloroflexi bacterium]|nr:Rieske 2Fe-2S protein [Chloroflexota bacterium]
MAAATDVRVSSGENEYTEEDWTEFSRTGPGTLAGRYLRLFWHPVYIAKDLAAGRAVPIRIMSEDFTLYRGEGGKPHVVAFRCAHRGTQLSTGWVEGDELRCFYHGWKYDGDGQCVEQPAEPEPFCSRIKIKAYPTIEYLGFVFAYLGEGEPPEFPRYPDFEGDGIHEANRYFMCVSFFNALDNDPVHVYFVHRAPRQDFRDWKGWTPTIRAEENEWGRANYISRQDGRVDCNLRGMPNLVIRKASGEGVGRSAESPRMDFLEWKVPIDDESHWNVHKVLVHLSGDDARRWEERREADVAARDVDPTGLVHQVLSGRLYMDQIDRERTRMTTVQDMVSQAGQGVIADRSDEHLGRTDVGVVHWRKIWERELRALAEGRPLTQWARPDSMVNS